MFDDYLHARNYHLDPRPALGGTSPSRHALNRQRYIAGKAARLEAEAAESRRAAINRILAVPRRAVSTQRELVDRAMNQLRQLGALREHPERRLG